MKLYIAALSLFILMISPSSQAQESDYINANFNDIAKTYWRIGYHTLDDKTAIDEFTRINYCSAYQTYQNDDFEWQYIRQAIAEEIKQDKDSYPNKYYITSKITINKYDFDQNAFLLEEDSQMLNVGKLTLLPYSDFKSYCDLSRYSESYPNMVSITLEAPITISSIPLEREEANQLLSRFNATKNNERILYAKINLNINGFGETYHSALQSVANLKGNLHSIEYYEDPDFTKLVHTFVPIKML